MISEKKKPVADIGVIVGRFQVPNLHEAHLELIGNVVERHSRTIIFLGLSPCLVTKNNPLDFEARKQMILQSFPDITVQYIKDIWSDAAWSKVLDEQIEDLATPLKSVMLYGGRDSFIRVYNGKYPTTELESTRYVSGSEIREQVSRATKASPDFRTGVIYAAWNKYPTCFTTVDVAIFDDKYERLLMARKPHEKLYRFVGGFATPNSPNFETDARREVAEEAGIEITDPVYIGSSFIKDWRYENEVDKIKTLFFTCKHMYGRPTAMDDIAELCWFDIKGIKNAKTSEEKAAKVAEFGNNVVETHRCLVEMLFNKVKL